VNLAESGDNIVDFDISESRYTTNPLNQNGGDSENMQNQSTLKKAAPESDAIGMSMESMDFGLSESNFSGANFTLIKAFTPAAHANKDRS